jgi:hypothetical protein
MPIMAWYGFFSPLALLRSFLGSGYACRPLRFSRDSVRELHAVFVAVPGTETHTTPPNHGKPARSG